MKAGDRHGRWTLVRFGPHGERRGGVRSRWTCRCVCGHTQPVFVEDLQLGRSTGCGEARCRALGVALEALRAALPEAAMVRLGAPPVVLEQGERVRVGQVFGRWVVRRHASPGQEGDRARPRALVECVCGVTRVVVERNLKRGRSLGCGDARCATSWEAWALVWRTAADPPPVFFGAIADPLGTT